MIINQSMMLKKKTNEIYFLQKIHIKNVLLDVNI